MVSPLWWPEEREDQLGWAPGSLSNDSWAESGDLALRELPTDICLLFARTGTLEGEIMPWDLTLSGPMTTQDWSPLCNPEKILEILLAIKVM